MKAIQSANGNPILSIREYDIATGTQIKIGQLVKLTAGLVVSCVAGETGAILGIAAENHSGSADALDPRSNGTKILVIDAPDAIYETPAFKLTASGGSATSVTATTLGAYSADDWNGGYLVLTKKASGSSNTDKIGTIKRITDYAYTAEGTISAFTVASAGAANEGDEYMLFPPLGLAKFNLNATFDGLVNTAVTATSVKVVGMDIERGVIKCMAKKHFLGNNE